MIQKKQKAYTFIEVVIAVAVFIVMSTITIAIIATSFNSRESSRNLADVEKNALRITQLFNNEVNLANGCRLWSASVGSYSVSGYYYGFMVLDQFDAPISFTPSLPPGVTPPDRYPRKITSSYEAPLNMKVDREYYIQEDASIGDGWGDLMLHEKTTSSNPNEFTIKINDDDVKVRLPKEGTTFSDFSMFNSTGLAVTGDAVYCGQYDASIPASSWSQPTLRIGIQVRSKNKDQKGNYAQTTAFKFLTARGFDHIIR